MNQETYEALNNIIIDAHQKYGDYTEASNALNVVANALGEIYRDDRLDNQ